MDRTKLTPDIQDITEQNKTPKRAQDRSKNKTRQFTDETKEKIDLINLENQILNEQRNAQAASPNFINFRKLVYGEKLDEFIDPQAKVFLLAFSVPPYYVPIQGKKAPLDHKKDIFKFAPIRPSRVPETLLQQFFGTEFEYKKPSALKFQER